MTTTATAARPSKARVKAPSKGRILIPEMPKVEITIQGTTPLLVHRMSEKIRKQLRDAHTKGKDPNVDVDKVAKRLAKEPRDPIQEALDGLYIIGERPSRDDFKVRDIDDIDPEEGIPLKIPLPKGSAFGFPGRAIKQALARAAQDREMTGSKKLTMIGARCMMFVHAHTQSGLVKIDVPKDNAMLQEWGIKTNGRDEYLILREDFVNIGKGQTRTSQLRWRFALWPWTATFYCGYDPHFLRVEHVAELFAAAGMGVGIGEWRSERGGDFGQFIPTSVVRIDS